MTFDIFLPHANKAEHMPIQLEGRRVFLHLHLFEEYEKVEDKYLKAILFTIFKKLVIDLHDKFDKIEEREFYNRSFLLF